MIQRIVLDDLGRKYPVTNMFDGEAKEVDDPIFAESIVILLGPGQWQALSAEQVSIITIH
jgi:hypothetical protein